MPEGRPSIKWRIKYEGVGLCDYVFAEDEAAAITKAREFYELPDDVEVTIVGKINEGAGVSGHMNRSLGFSGKSIAPQRQSATV